jgi:hypothetical protein
MAAAFEGGEVGHQELTAPDRAVGAVAGPVEGHPDHRAARPVVSPAVIGQAGGDVRVMVLDPEQVHVGQVERVLGGQVLRMQVMGHDLRVDVEQPAEMLDALGERAQGLGVLQVPDVVGDKGVAILGQAERVLQFGPAGQHGTGEPAGHRDGFGDIAAGPPDEHRPATEHPGDGVIRPDVNGPVVGEERVRDPAEPGQHLVIVVDDRLVGAVPAGQHDRTGGGLEQQVVQRSVGQHDAERAVPGGGRRGDAGARAPGEQHDGTAGTGQQGRRYRVDLAQPPHRGQVRGQDRERLVLAVLACPQLRDGLLVGRVRREVITA